MAARRPSAAYSIQPGDARSDVTRELAERELALPDPVDLQPLTLADLLHPEANWWPQKFDQHLAAVLGKAARRPEPVQIPDAATLRPLLWSCQGGHDGNFDNSSAWRNLFGTAGDVVQNYVRGMFKICQDLKYPKPDQYELLVHASAAHIIAMFEQAAELQRSLIAKAAERKGPAAKAQAAAQLLELTPGFQAAYLAWGETVRDASGVPYAELGQILPRLRGRLERELS